MHHAAPKATVIIPARLGSERFPRKVLAADTGTPMVVHVCQRAAQASCAQRVVVATDAPEVADAVKEHGFDAVMTGEHPNGTSRLAEAARALELKEHDVVVNVQGDEPEIEPQLIDAAALSLTVNDPSSSLCSYANVATVASPFTDEELAAGKASNPNIVKAVIGALAADIGVGKGLYFSRALVPSDRDREGQAGSQSPYRPLKHLGLYAYTMANLQRYLTLAPTPLERTEKLEQLRWLEHGLTVAVAVRQSSHHGIDTEDQYKAFVERFAASGQSSV